MASYTKTVIKGKVINALRYRGHAFMETWRKDGVMTCDGSTILTQVNHLFEEVDDKELAILENLGFKTDYELEEDISTLCEYEERYKAAGQQ